MIGDCYFLRILSPNTHCLLTAAPGPMARIRSKFPQTWIYYMLKLRLGEQWRLSTYLSRFCKTWSLLCISFYTHSCDLTKGMHYAKLNWSQVFFLWEVYTKAKVIYFPNMLWKTDWNTARERIWIKNSRGLQIYFNVWPFVWSRILKTRSCFETGTSLIYIRKIHV
jgi:hypothetical protein